MIPKSPCLYLQLLTWVLVPRFQLPVGYCCPESAIIPSPHVQTQLNTSAQLSFLPQFFFPIKWAVVILMLLAESPRKNLESSLFCFWWQHLWGFFESFFSCHFNFLTLPYPATPDDWLQSLHTNPNCTPFPIPFLKGYLHQTYWWLPTSWYEVKHSCSLSKAHLLCLDPILSIQLNFPT